MADNIGISNAFSFVINVLSNTWDWLMSWNYKGVPFGVFLIAIAVIAIILDYVF